MIKRYEFQHKNVIVSFSNQFQVREQASRFLESYFKESLGSRHPALTILRRLSAQVDHLTRKPKDGERSLKVSEMCSSKYHR